MSGPGAGPSRRVVAAHAKVNLFLRVVGRRADGYHDLESVVVPVDLADRVEVTVGGPDPEGPDPEGPAFDLEVVGRPELVGAVPAGGANLAVRAASLLAARLGGPGTDGPGRGPVRVRLEKRIPVAAGLGGGSADAAAVLRALNELWPPGLGRPELTEVAAQVGSDVPALLDGGPVLVGGRGERVAPVRPGRPVRLALVTFDRGVSTAKAFEWWDHDGDPTGPDPAAAIEAFEGGADPATLGRVLFNDLQPSVARRRPDVRAVLERVAGIGVPALMSGSGPTVFGLLEDGGWTLGRADEDELRRLSGGEVLYVRTIGPDHP